jgi:Zn-dependent protease
VLPLANTAVNRSYGLGRVLGLRVTAETSAFVALIVLWAVLAVIGSQALGLTGPDVVVGGALTVALHVGLTLAHHLGHALAAERSGYPMVGIHLWLLLARSIYPANEPPLPARIHIRRALGGPIASAVVGVILGILALLLSPVGGMVYAMVVFLFLDNLLVFTVGALLPVPIADGGTLRTWWPRR